MIVLMALPRSGSTLTYQLLVHGFRLSYLSNFANMLFQLPLVGGFFSSIICRRYKSDFTSTYGFVGGGCGPAEGLQFWSYWLGYGLDERLLTVMDEPLRERRLRYLRRVLSLLSHTQSPYISGFLGHSLEPQRVIIEFPHAIMVRLHRDPLSNALSLLNSRRVSGGAWFSLFPHECESVIGKGEHAEVAAQVYWLNRRLDDELKGESVFHLDYEQLCQNPAAQLKHLSDFCNRRGMSVSLRGRVPDEFEYKMSDMQQNSDVIKLRMELGELESCYGPLQGRGG
jgi:hypothetical protein